MYCVGSRALTVLLLDENRIQQLPENLFLELSILRILRLRENKIGDVHSNSFAGLVELTELDLTGNRIPTLPLGVFDPLGLLESLSLANNNIRRVAREPFQSCRDLRTLNVANNSIPVISADWFVSTTRLKSLKVASNRIQNIEPRAFDKLQQLEELDLSDNYLSDLGQNLFINCGSLQKLNLARNPLRHLASPGTTFAGLTALRRLDLKKCCITELALNSSVPLPALTELYLGDNLLTNISRHTLAATTSLQKLDLGYNIISAVEAGALSSLSSLNWLNLSNNLLTEDQLTAALRTVPSDVVVDASWNRVKSLMSLTVPLAGIYLSGNSLVCSCTLPSWISLADTVRFLDVRQTLCTSASESMYLLCYWSRYCDSSAEHQLCTALIPSETNSTASSPSKACQLDAALRPRFVNFNVHARSPTSAQLTWNVSDELSTMVGYRFTFTVVFSCTNASEAIFYPTGYETSHTTIHDNDVNRTSIEIGNLTSGEVYVACADVLQTPRGSSNETSVSDTECACLELLSTNIRIWARSNDTSIFVRWAAVNSTSQFTYFQLICFDDRNSKVVSVAITGYSYVIGNLLQDSAYNICVTAISHRNFQDPTHCVRVHTDKTSPYDSVDMDLFLILVTAVPVACLVLVLIITCIVMIIRWQIKPKEVESMSSSTCDKIETSESQLQDQSSQLGWSDVMDPLPLQSTILFNIYDSTMSY